MASYSAGISINDHPIAEPAVTLLLMIVKRTSEENNSPSEMASQNG
jgi:hypothetical protein